MKVVYVTSASYIDHSYTIVQELRKHIDDFSVYLQARESNDEIKTWCSKLNASFVKRKRFRNPLSIFSELGFILKIRKIKADIVWFNTLSVYQMFLVKMLIKKFLVVVHDVEIHPGGGAGHGTLSVEMMIKFAKKNICVVSQAQANLFKENYGIEPKIFQLPIINYYREISNNKISNKTDGKIHFFFFGSIEPYKGIETLIGAAEILGQEDLDFRLNIYGKIKYNTGALTAKIESVKNAVLYDTFVDYREVYNIYNQNDVIILPYKQVTQCGPLLIGFDAAVPAICSNLPGFTEYVNDGNDGIIFNNTEEDLAVKMKLFINDKDLVLRIKNNIKSKTSEKFSMAYLWKSYLQNLSDELKQ